MTSSTRNAHLALADDRAMEEMGERHNPVNPKKLLNNRRETAMRNVGAGATPSMGLSEFRGGKKMLGRAQNLHQAEPSEAHQMGLHLGKHLRDLHGGAYHKEFLRGMGECGDDAMDALSGGRGRTSADDRYEAKMDAWEESGKAGPMPKVRERSREELMSKSEQGAERRREGLKQYGIPQLADKLNETVGSIPGIGSHLQKYGEQMAAATIPGAKGYTGRGKTGAYEGQGRRRRAPAGASDGRRKRADIVKKVMAEKGLKMIEASKYVKEHGLY